VLKNRNPHYDCHNCARDSIQTSGITLHVFLASLNVWYSSHSRGFFIEKTHERYVEDLLKTYVQHISLFSQLQLSGSFRQDGHMIMPHPTQVLFNLLQPQCLHSFIPQFTADIYNHLNYSVFHLV
jgi:hypothetical protein